VIGNGRGGSSSAAHTRKNGYDTSDIESSVLDVFGMGQESTCGLSVYHSAKQIVSK